MILSWLLRVLVFVVLVRAAWRFLSGVLEGMAPPARPSRSQAPDSVALARDPVCGTFVVPSRAIATGHGPNRQFFCSERCRDLHASGRRLAS